MSWGWLVVALIVGIWIGWGWAHVTVADECEKLGAFYVKDKVYHCSTIEKKDGETP